jgi:hypothetical protein
MTPNEEEKARELIIDLRKRGLVVLLLDGRLGTGPAELLTPTDRALTRLYRGAMTRVLEAEPHSCPRCKTPVEPGGFCRQCHDRPCAGCSKWTGSKWAERCAACRDAEWIKRTKKK